MEQGELAGVGAGSAARDLTPGERKYTQSARAQRIRELWEQTRPTSRNDESAVKKIVAELRAESRGIGLRVHAEQVCRYLRAMALVGPELRVKLTRGAEKPAPAAAAGGDPLRDALDIIDRVAGLPPASRYALLDYLIEKYR